MNRMRIAAWVLGEMVGTALLLFVFGCGLDMGVSDMGDTDTAADALHDTSGWDSIPHDDPPEELALGPEDWELDCLTCSSHDECDDGLFCTGPPECVYSQHAAASCCRPAPVDCETEDPCQVGSCSEETGGCVIGPRDDDGDGHASVECGHDDCDDSLYSVHPGAEEICDDIDNDCDTVADEDGWKPSGEVIDLTTSSQVPSSPSLASSPTALGVAWIVDEGTGATARAGVIVPGVTATPAVSEVILAAGEPSEVTIVSVSDGFAMFAAVTQTPGTGTVVAAHVASDGTVSATEHTILGIDAPILDITVATTPAGTHLGLLFRSDLHGDYEIYFLPIDWPTPAAATEAALVRITSSSGFSGRPAAVGMETGFAVAWEDARDGNTEVYFALLEASGTPSGPARRITAAPGDSESVALASGSSGFALAWMDSRTGGYDLLFTCLDETGARVCPEMGIGAVPEVAWYPVLSPGTIEGQYVLSFAGREEGLFRLHLTAVAAQEDSTPAQVQPGVVLGSGSTGILEPGLAETDAHRGLIWIDDSPSTGTILKFQQMACED